MPEPVSESIEATPSDVEVTPPAPSETTVPEPPTETTETATPAVPTVELFELPDGRKVDASTLSKEWKENFYPDYTRKSQELAAKNGKPPETLPTATKNPFADPSYVPQSYEEIIEAAKTAALSEIETRQRQEIEARQAIESAVETQLNEIKTTDPALNENELFLHATKYGFRDLKLAHANMKAMSDLVKKVQTKTADNITKRNDPVSITPGGNGTKPNPSNFATAQDYLRSLKQ